MTAKALGFVNKTDAGSTVRTYYLPFNKLNATAAPGVTDDDAAGYVAGSIWADRTNDKIYLCTDNATGAATWVEVAAGGGSYTDEEAQDAVGGILTDTATIDFTYTDGGPTIEASVKSASITEAMQVLADNTTQDVSTTKHGYVPKAPNDTTKFLRGDGDWAVPSGSEPSDGDKGDITVSGSGLVWDIDANAVTNTELADMPAHSFKGVNGASGDPQDIESDDLTDATATGADLLLGWNGTTKEFRRFTVSHIVALGASQAKIAGRIAMRF